MQLNEYFKPIVEEIIVEAGDIIATSNNEYLVVEHPEYDKITMVLISDIHDLCRAFDWINTPNNMRELMDEYKLSNAVNMGKEAPLPVILPGTLVSRGADTYVLSRTSNRTWVASNVRNLHVLNSIYCKNKVLTWDHAVQLLGMLSEYTLVRQVE